jgi:hypothetical protein
MIPRMFCLISMASILFFNGCAPNIKYLSPKGDDTEVRLTDNTLIKGELLMVSDSTICVVVGPPIKSITKNAKYELHIVPVQRIQQVKIKGYSNKKWVGSVVAFQLVPALLLGLSAASADADAMAVIGISSVPTLFSLGLLAAGTPSDPGIKYPITSDQLNEIRKYAHFPQGLTVNELETYTSSRNFFTQNY